MTTTPTLWKLPHIANPGSARAGDQARPQILGLSDGRILTLWQDSSNGTDPGTDIIGRFFTPEGEIAGGLVRFNTVLNNGDEVDVRAAALPDGGFVIAYADVSANFMIVVERFDANGNRVFFDLVTDGDDGLGNWDIVADPTGDYTLVFERDVTSAGPGIPNVTAPQVHSIIWDFAGNDRGEERRFAAQNTYEPDWLAAAATLANGHLVVLARDDDAYGFPFEGYPQPTTEFTVTNPHTGARVRKTAQIAGSEDHKATPIDVATLAGGQIVIVYRDIFPDFDTTENSLWFRVVASEAPGSHVGDPVRLPTYGVPQQEARVIGLQDGGFFIVWVEDHLDEIRGLRYSASGQPIGANRVVAEDVFITGNAANRTISDLSLTSDGRILLAYQTDSFDIGQVILDPRQTIQVGTDASETITSQTTSSSLSGQGGDDRLYGQAGDDLLRGDSGRDTIYGGGGRDRIRGGTEDDTLYGGEGDDTLFGDEGNDLIDGGNGEDDIYGLAGRDILQGGLGDDTYNLSDVNFPELDPGAAREALAQAVPAPPTATYSYDRINEFGGGGTDTVRVQRIATPGQHTATAYTLPNQVENGQIIGSGGFSLTGNALANVLLGNGAANTLDGRGGADSMRAGAGDDTYVVDNAGDAVFEETNAGTDTVNSSIRFSLAGLQVEKLVLTGTGNIDGTGNQLANTLTGNSGRNVLSGGSNADRMEGKAGDDIYVVDNTGDAVVEGSNQGVDRVESSVSFTLAPSVENLTLTGGAAINGTGNDVANVIRGNTGSNRLTGGRGGDDLYAGADNVRDVFAFAAGDSGLSAATIDEIFQFDRSTRVADTTNDRIDLSLIDADPDPGNQAFRFVTAFSTAAASQSNGQVRVDVNGANSRVAIDIDGDNAADMILAIIGVTGLTSRDFIL